MVILNSNLLHGTYIIPPNIRLVAEILKELEWWRRSGRTDREDGRTDRQTDGGTDRRPADRTQWPTTIPVGADGGRVKIAEAINVTMLLSFGALKTVAACKTVSDNKSILVTAVIAMFLLIFQAHMLGKDGQN